MDTNKKRMETRPNLGAVSGMRRRAMNLGKALHSYLGTQGPGAPDHQSAQFLVFMSSSYRQPGKGECLTILGYSVQCQCPDIPKAVQSEILHLWGDIQGPLTSFFQNVDVIHRANWRAF